jgi:hypothetical protein
MLMKLTLLSQFRLATIHMILGHKERQSDAEPKSFVDVVRASADDVLHNGFSAIESFR